jgi:hypothetical protein
MTLSTLAIERELVDAIKPAFRENFDVTPGLK